MDNTGPSITVSSIRLKIILGLILAIILLAFLIFFLSPKRTSKPSPEIPRFSPSPIANYVPAQFTPSSSFPYTLVYGVWSGNNSLIKSYDLSTGQTSTLATLPSTIKKVSFISADQILYINKTNDQDYGQELILYSLNNKSSQVILTADSQFGIDEYVNSPNKKYLAVFEVSLAANASKLLGAPTRSYSLDITTSQAKNLIFDEVSSESNPIHFPVAITDSGETYFDKFLPNSGAGWAYGISVSSFDGSTKEDVASMANGTYGTRPVLSPKGDSLIFAGYDGQKGDGTALVDGFRRSIIAANTVELFDFQTKTRQPLVNLSNENTYSFVDIDKLTGKIIFIKLSKNQADTGTYLYNLDSQTAKKVSKQDNQNILSLVDKNNILIATTDPSQSTVGNLGQTYSASVTHFYLVDSFTNQSQMIKLTDSLMQFIDVQPLKVLGTSSQVLAESTSNKTLQLSPLTIKPPLAEIRTGINNDPPPPPPPPLPLPPPPSQPTVPPIIIPPKTPPVRQAPMRCDLYRAVQCAAIIGADINQCRYVPNDPDIPYQDCGFSDDVFWPLVFCVRANNPRAKGCFASPLYLYGEAGQRVKVNINTAIYSPNTSYQDGLDITLQGNGDLNVDGQIVESIAYDFEPGIRRFIIPKTGSVASRQSLSEVLTYYAQKLGLNEKETSDLISRAQSLIISPYVFVSFFDEQTSKQILPLSFKPEPQTYINIVFYFKELYEPLDLTPLPPIFPQIKERQGLTAVEISELID